MWQRKPHHWPKLKHMYQKDCMGLVTNMQEWWANFEYILHQIRLFLATCIALLVIYIFVVTCHQPEIPSETGYRSFDVVQLNPNLYRVGGAINFNCVGTKHLSGPDSITCLADGTWTGEPASCISNNNNIIQMF